MDAGLQLYHLPGFYEPFNAISHLLATMLFFGLGVKLVRKGWGIKGNGIRGWKIIFLVIYSLSCVFLFSMSAVFHMLVRDYTASMVMQRLDHGAIFILIAGTFTAVHGLVFKGWIRWVPLLLIWTLAVTSITLKTVFFNSLPEWLGLTFYIGLGLLAALSAIPIYRKQGFRYLSPLVYGGLAYSVGGIMEFLGLMVVIPGVVHAHEIWHLMVLTGALLHWWFVWIVTGEVLESGGEKTK